jgi:hypothetical protein
MKNIPPIVGVPAFLKCAWGPSSRMICPVFRACNNGITHRPKIVAPTAHNISGRVREVVSQGVLSPIPSKIKAVVTRNKASNKANPVPEKFKL